MGGMDVLTLSRIQFGATIAFHYIYPPLSIGLGLLLVIACIGVPAVIAYTVSIYWIFRGKVKLDRVSY
jgi:cytochrome bd-type quinol oxidase subunit 1